MYGALALKPAVVEDAAVTPAAALKKLSAFISEAR